MTTRPCFRGIYASVSQQVCFVDNMFCLLSLISEVVNLPEEKVDKGIADGTFVDYVWKGHQLSVTVMASIKQVTDKVNCFRNFHLREEPTFNLCHLMFH